MNVINIGLAIIFFINFILSTLVFIHRKENEGSVFFAIAAYCITLWVLAMFFFRVIGEHFLILPAKLLYVAGILIATNFLYFARAFQSGFVGGKKNLFHLPYIFSIVIIGLIIFSKTIIEGVIISEGERIVSFGIFYPVYGFLMFFYFSLAYAVLFKKFIKAQAETLTRLQLSYVIVGTLISVILALIFDIILPYFGSFTLYWLGPAIAIIFVVATTYSIFKHRLFNIKVIATELLTFSIWIFLLIQTFLAQTLQGVIVNGTLFLLVIFFGVFLIRSVNREVRNREQIETLNVQLQRSIEELRKLDQLKTDFVNIASHQLRTPLTPIKGFSDMLRRGEIGSLTEEQKDVTNKIFSSSQKMVELIDDFLNVSRLEKEGGFTYNFAVENPEPVVKKVVDDLQDQAKERGLALSFESYLSPDIKIKIDSLKFSNAISNIVHNATKYTPRGSIWVKLREVGNDVLISIKDTGIGIDPGDIPKIFQKFFRGKEVSRLSTEGTGLGLYFSRRVIEDHGGHIWVQSEGIEKGTEFTIRLPKAQAQVASSPQPAQAPIANAGLSGPVPLASALTPAPQSTSATSPSSPVNS